MNSRRTIILVIAIAMAGLAAMGLLIYVRGLEESAYEGRELVSVWVAEGDILKGATGGDLAERGLIVQKQIPTEFAPELSIDSPDVEIAGLVAVNDIANEQIIVTGMFKSPAVVVNGVTDRLEERIVEEENARRQDMTTFTFNIAQTTGVAGLLEPGDFVNMMTGGEIPARDEAAEEQLSEALSESFGEEVVVRTGSIYNVDARYIYQKAEILAIDTRLPATVDAPEGEAVVTGGGLVTVAVPPEVAQVLFAIDSFYLTLVSPDYEPWPLPPLDLNAEIFPAENCELLTPYGPPALESENDKTVCERYEEELKELSSTTNARP